MKNRGAFLARTGPGCLIGSRTAHSRKANMKNSISLAGITLLLAVSNLSAGTHYVPLERTNPRLPYTYWAAAARDDQSTQQ